MLEETELRQSRMYLESLSGLKRRLDSSSATYVQLPLVSQIGAEVEDALANLAAVRLPAWNREAFFEYENEDARYYRREELGAYLTRLIARLNEAIRETAVRRSVRRLV